MRWKLPGRSPVRSPVRSPYRSAQATVQSRAQEWSRVAPLHGVTEAAPPLVAAPRFELPKVTGAASLLPDAAPHRPLPPPLPAHSTPSSRTTRAAQTAALPPITPAPSQSQEFPRAGESPYFADQELDLAQFLTPAADTEAGYDDVPAGEPTPEAPAIAPEPVEQPSGDGLAGIIAMLDAEVARTRSDDGPAFPPADEDEATEKIYRPSLAESRRRGFAVGTGPAPTEGAGPAASPEPASAGEAEPTPAEPSAGTDVRGGEPRPVEASLVTATRKQPPTGRPIRRPRRLRGSQYRSAESGHSVRSLTAGSTRSLPNDLSSSRRSPRVRSAPQ